MGWSVDSGWISGLAGFQIRTITSTAPTVAIAAMMSVISTVMKFEVTYWASAKVAPATSATGQVCRMPRSPSTMNTSTRGTIRATNGVCRPAIWDSVCRSIPVTADSVMIGAPIAPNATGAVLASRETVAA
ncbi:MAG TPA: hypothetical protein VNA11_13150, partial [Pseudonocardia sp.]|nr:hypothetical protein [Pseudonocardia sp.]